MDIFQATLTADLQKFFEEDDLQGNAFYLKSLPADTVSCQLKIKSDVVLSGLPYFVHAFNFLGANLNYSEFEKYEGQEMKKGDIIPFELPFSIALSGERVALNLVQRSSAVSTFTKKFVDIAKPSGIKILDTRKTTPGLRSLEKYAVRIGGAFNHRFSQADVWMIKDNHKTFFGGLKPAWDYFKNMQTFYQAIVVEIHSLDELKLAIDLGVKHMMLDNFSEADLRSAISLKPAGATYEISGGVKLENLQGFLINGIDAISVGALTHSVPHVDLSLKYKRASK